MKSSIKLTMLTLCASLSLAFAQTASPSLTSAKAVKNVAMENNPMAASLKIEVIKLQKDLSAYQSSLDKKADAATLKAAAIQMHRHWLSFENSVRDLYPLLYTDVEKYETPLFYGSSRESIDYDQLNLQTKGLSVALISLLNAKETNAVVSEVLQQSVEKYQNYVKEQVEDLNRDTQLFIEAVKANDRAKAKYYYAIARVPYERIEPIAESFADLDPKIDSRLADVEAGALWTGFHPLERAIWENKPLDTPEVHALADQLMSDVFSLKQAISTIKLEAKPMVAGAMELLNEAASTKITGEEEAYSHLDLLDFYANVEGAKAVYLAIIPALNVSQKPLIQKLDGAFSELETALNQYRKGNDFASYTELKAEDIRTLSNKLTQLAELIRETGNIFQ